MEIVLSAVSFCCEPIKDCSDEFCCKVGQIVILAASIAFGLFDTVTDWIAWASLRSDNYGLLEASDALIYVWLGFSIVGTVLLAISIITDLINLRYNITFGGWNPMTFSEFQSFLNLMLEDLPIIILTCIYIVSRNVCQQFDPSLDTGRVSSSYRELFISILFTLAAVIYRTCRSFGRLCYSRGKFCGCQWCCEGLAESERVCPSDTCAGSNCEKPYACFLMLQLFLVFTGTLMLALAAVSVFTVFGFGSPAINWNITRSDPVATGNNATVVTVLSDTKMLVRNGSLSITEVFHEDLGMTTYCLAHFELQPQRIVFNIAHINMQNFNSQICNCNFDSTSCERFYKHLSITGLYPVYPNFFKHLGIEAAKARSICSLPVKPLQRDRSLNTCNCDFSNIVEHRVGG